jgi:hypothetical protein
MAIKYPSLEECSLELAGDIAQRGLHIAFKDTKDMSFGTEMYKLPLFHTHGAIRNRIYTMLQNSGILDSFHYTMPIYRHGETHPDMSKTWFGTANQEWFEKNSPAMGKAPVFQTSGTKKEKEYSYSKEEDKLIMEKDNYRALFSCSSHFTNAEYIYIYWHLDEYDAMEVTFKLYKQYANLLSIYPKVLLSNLSKGVFHGHAMNYLENNIQWVLKNILKIEDDPVIDKLDLSTMHPKFSMKGMNDWNAEFVSKQLERIAAFKTMLKIGEQSLTRLQSTIEKFGGWDKLKSDSRSEFIKYLEENFPLHLSADETDKDLKELCEWVQEGKNKGFNERTQKVA